MAKSLLFEMEENFDLLPLVYHECNEEHWRPIKGYGGIYQVSTFGRIKTTIRKGCSVEFLKFQHNKKGYPIVTLGCRKDGSKVTKPVHRFVAEAFIGNPKGLAEVNHIDENKENNCVWNLEWCDHLYNIRYGTGIKRNAKTSMRVVNQYDFEGNLLWIWESVSDIAASTGLDGGCLSRACSGKSHTYAGFIWIYDSDPLKEEKLKFKLEWAKSHPSYGIERPVMQFTLNGDYIQTFPSVRQAERETGIDASLICVAIHKKHRSKGYLWKYTKDYSFSNTGVQ